MRGSTGYSCILAGGLVGSLLVFAGVLFVVFEVSAWIDATPQAIRSSRFDPDQDCARPPRDHGLEWIFRRLDVDTGWSGRVWASLLLALELTLGGCGGGGGEMSFPSTPSTAGGISGTATKGPVAGATMTAYAIESGAIGHVLGSAITGAQGDFSISMDSFSGPVMLRMTGGHFMDEARGIDMSMQQGDVMTAMVPSVLEGSVTSGIQVTPLTSMAQAMAQRMTGGMSAANITLANPAIGCYFMVGDILHVHPINPLTPSTGNPPIPDERNYGMVMAAMAQLAADLGMPFASGLMTAMMDDVSDGRLNGMSGNAAVMMGGGMMSGTALPSYGGTSGMSNAMAQFVRSPMNRSGVTIQDMQALINRLMASTGDVPVGTCPP